MKPTSGLKRTLISHYLLALMLGLGVIAPGPVTAQEPGTATLASSAAAVVSGDEVQLTGQVAAGPECSSGRAVELERQIAGTSTWESIEPTLSGADGAFGFATAPAHTASYRAVVGEAEGGCPALVSESVSVAASAAVSASLSRTTVGASGCADMTVLVSPDKLGSTVRIQRYRPGGWRKILTVTLGEGSSAVGTLCFRWEDLGAVQLRARWPRQDPLNTAGTSATLDVRVVKPPWMRRLDRLTRNRGVSVSVRDGGSFVYRRRDTAWRIPASNQKLLLSMGLLERLGPDFRFVTKVVGPAAEDGVIRGDVWIVGRGDPGTGKREIGRLARQIARSGVRRIRGSVRGSKRYFGRDWWAPGWKWYFPRYNVALPTALTYRFNRADGRHIRDPERRAARALTRRLEALGVRVRGAPGSGYDPGGLTTVAEIRSLPLSGVVRAMNVYSSNFYAEVLGKRLGVAGSGAPGTIAKGAAATAAWAAGRGVSVSARDGSGLSYSNRVTAVGVARLLGVAEARPWGASLHSSLPRPGQGTLSSRLSGVPVRAKTGTLSGVSALSGWVWLERTQSWAEFSILSAGLSKSRAVSIEDAVVRILWDRAR